MTALIKNIAASILAKLKNEAERQSRPFAEILQYYVMERFLYRLSQTKYAEKFILKGGLLFYVWDIPLRRATRDIDFRGYVANDHETLLKIFKEVMEVSAPEDGIAFDSESIFCGRNTNRCRLSRHARKVDCVPGPFKDPHPD